MAWSEKAIEAALDAMDKRWRNPHGEPDWEKKMMRLALDAAAAVDGDAQLSRYSDDEIAAEYFRRAQEKLGDQRISVRSLKRLK